MLRGNFEVAVWACLWHFCFSQANTKQQPCVRVCSVSVQAVFSYGNAPFSSRRVKILPEHPKGISPPLLAYTAALCHPGRVSLPRSVDSADL